MSKIFFPGTAGDYDSVFDGRASGGIIIDSEKTIIIDPGIGFIVKSGLNKADIILLSDNNRLYSNDSAILIERFRAEILENNTEDIKKIQNSFRINTPRYLLGYISMQKMTKAFAEEFKDANILVIRSETTSVKDMISLIENINPELAILTGFKKGIDPLEFSRHVKDELKIYSKEHAAKDTIRTQVIAAKEQMLLNPESYNIKLRQRSLKGFV
jgi:hypothetical protein